MYGELVTGIRSQVKVETRKLGDSIAIVASSDNEEKFLCLVRLVSGNFQVIVDGITSNVK